MGKASPTSLCTDPYRLKQLGEADRARLLAYVAQEPEYNLFLIGDIENFGMRTDYMDVMAFEPDGAFDSVLLRYYDSFIPYSHKDDFAAEPVLSALSSPGLRVLSGKKSVLDRLKPHLEHFNWKDSFLMKLDLGVKPAVSLKGLSPEVEVRLASPEDAPAIVDLVDTIEEFAAMRSGSRDVKIRQLSGPMSSGAGHYVIAYAEGRLVGVAGTTAENSLSAMVVSVATAPDWRGRGLASRLVTELAALQARLGRQYLCLFYSNPDAGRIYRRLGFTDAGQWTLATRKTETGET